MFHLYESKLAWFIFVKGMVFGVFLSALDDYLKNLYQEDTMKFLALFAIVVGTIIAIVVGYSGARANVGHKRVMWILYPTSVVIGIALYYFVWHTKPV